MRITIVAVHPTVTMVKHDAGQFELPTAWFTTTPVIGQTWNLTLDHQPSESEKLDHLNDFLVRD